MAKAAQLRAHAAKLEKVALLLDDSDEITGLDLGLGAGGLGLLGGGAYGINKLMKHRAATAAAAEAAEAAATAAARKSMLLKGVLGLGGVGALGGAYGINKLMKHRAATAAAAEAAAAAAETAAAAATAATRKRRPLRTKGRYYNR